MKINYFPLTADQIPFLNNQKALFLLDYRILGESLEYEIPSMRKYENLLPWILINQNIAVNQYSKELHYVNTNYLLLAKTWESAKESVIKRIEKDHNDFLHELNSIIAFVPHPDVDKFCIDFWKTNYYSYENFLKYNNKLAQKQLVSQTPQWKRIHSLQELSSLSDPQGWYIKRAIGSWGFTVFKVDSILNNKEFNELFISPEERYLEKSEDWIWMSIQILKEGQEITVFALTEQCIKNEKEFYWAKMLPLSMIENNIFLKNFIEQTITELSAWLLSSYQGFWGIDFIYHKDKQKFFFLEWNIRLTAMTIPTLLHNQNSQFYAFYEDLTKEEISNIPHRIIGYDSFYDCYDVCIS